MIAAVGRARTRCAATGAAERDVVALAREVVDPVAAAAAATLASLDGTVMTTGGP